MKKLHKLLKWLLIVFVILIILLTLLMRSGISPYRCDRLIDNGSTLASLLCGDKYWENHEKYWYSNENDS